MVFVEPEHLRARAEPEAKLGDHRRGLQPAAGWRRRHHVAGNVDNVEMDGITNNLTETADCRFSGPQAPDRDARTLRAAHLDHRPVTLDRTWPQFQRRLFADQPAALSVVTVGQKRLDRHFDEIRIAVKAFPVGKGKFGTLDLQVDEVWADWIKAIKIVALQECELLQHYRPLTPDAGLAHRVAAVVVGQWRLD